MYTVASLFTTHFTAVVIGVWRPLQKAVGPVGAGVRALYALYFSLYYSLYYCGNRCLATPSESRWFSWSKALSAI
jgi:hypothetical protein